MFYDIVELGVPIYDRPVRADHAHTKKPSCISARRVRLENGTCQALWNRSKGPFVWPSGEICLSSLCNTIGCAIFIHWIGLNSI